MAYQHHDVRFAEIKPIDYYGAASRGMRDGLAAVGHGMAMKQGMEEGERAKDIHGTKMDEQARFKKLQDRLLQIYGGQNQAPARPQPQQQIQPQQGQLPSSEEVIRRMMGNGGRVTGGTL